MNLEILLAFLLGMIILSATPGPGVIASISKAVSEGFKSSLYFIAGLVVGDTIFFLLALLGMSAVSKIMGEMFLIIKIAGGIYLIFLGIKMFRRKNFEINTEEKIGGNNLQNIISGLMVTLGNPKPILFYASILPTILDINRVTFIETIVMITLIGLVSYIVLGTYSYFASLTRKIVLKERTQKNINKSAGLVMAAAGSYIIVK